MKIDFEGSLRNSFEKYEAISKDVSSTQKDLRKNLKGGVKPSIEEFRGNLDEVIESVLATQDANLWLSVLPKDKSKVRDDLEKTCTNFFAESMRSSDDTSIFYDKEKLREVVEYLLYQQENIRNLIQKDKDYTRLSAYNNYEFIDKFLHDDEFIAKELDMPLEEVKSIFTQGQKKHFIVNNISIMEALHKVKDNVENILTDENIARELDMEVAEVKDFFTKSKKSRIAIGNPSDPMSFLIKIKHNLDTVLTDENIAHKLGMSVEEVNKRFSKNRKIRIVIDHPADPMENFIKINKNIEEVLNDENIARELGVPVGEIEGVFTKAIKNFIAENYISKPVKAIAQIILGEIKTGFTPKNLSEELKAKARVYLENKNKILF